MSPRSSKPKPPAPGDPPHDDHIRPAPGGIPQVLPSDGKADGAPKSHKTEDQWLLDRATTPLPEHLFEESADAWRVFRIMGEFVAGFEEMGRLGPCVCSFGSARVTAADPMYHWCVKTARMIGEAGFGIITAGARE